MSTFASQGYEIGVSGFSGVQHRSHPLLRAQGPSGGYSSPPEMDSNFVITLDDVVPAVHDNQNFNQQQAPAYNQAPQYNNQAPAYNQAPGGEHPCHGNISHTTMSPWAAMWDSILSTKLGLASATCCIAEASCCLLLQMGGKETLVISHLMQLLLHSLSESTQCWYHTYVFHASAVHVMWAKDDVLATLFPRAIKQ